MRTVDLTRWRAIHRLASAASAAVVHEMRMVLKDGRFLGARGAVGDEDLFGVGFNVSPVGAAEKYSITSITIPPEL